MIRKIICTISVFIFLFESSSCTMLQKPIDNRSGFSRQLQQTEAFIRIEDWENAKAGLEESNKAWKKIKPWLQIDIDHDYVNDIEKEFVKLNGYISTGEKPDSLASVMLIQDIWKNISSF